MFFQRYCVLFTYVFCSLFLHVHAAAFDHTNSETNFANAIRVIEDDDEDDYAFGLRNVANSEMNFANAIRVIEDDDEDDYAFGLHNVTNSETNFANAIRVIEDDDEDDDYAFGLCNITDSQAKSKRPKKTKYKYEFALGAVIQNEARFIKEWLEYYKINGVQHFYIYDNRSMDNIKEVLAPYIASGEVELFDWDVDANDLAEYLPMQVNAYKEVLKRARGNVKWLGLLDIDEYVVPNMDSTLIKYLGRFERSTVCGGLSFIWVFFGTSDVPRKPDDKVLIEVLLGNGGRTCNGVADCVWRTGSYKSIAMVDRVDDVASAHYFVYKKGYHHQMPNFDQAQINHYWAGDLDYFENVKIPRRATWGQAPSSAQDWERGMHNINDFSYKILRFVPELRKRMGMD